MKVPPPPPRQDEADTRADIGHLLRPPRSGRPSKYKADYARQARMLAGREWTNEQIAEFLQISISTMYRWLDEHADFRDAVRLVRENLEDNIERTLASRALGYKYKDTHITHYQGEIIKTKVIKEAIPDVKAATWWLSNRRAAKWSMNPQASDAPPVDETPLSSDEAYLIDNILGDTINEQ